MHPKKKVLTAGTLLFCALSFASHGHAIEIEDGTSMFGLDTGIGAPEGSSKNALGQPAILGGQIFYDKMGEWGTGLQINHFNFKSKQTGRAHMTSVLLAERANIPMKSDIYVPYLLAGIGYAEGNAQLPDGGYDHGSGLGLCIGGGIDRFLTEHLSAGLEFRLDRMSAPLGHMGISGATAASLLLKLNFWLGPEGSPFESGGK